MRAPSTKGQTAERAAEHMAVAVATLQLVQARREATVMVAASSHVTTRMLHRVRKEVAEEVIRAEIFLLRKVLPEVAAQKAGEYLAAPADGQNGLTLPEKSPDKGNFEFRTLGVQHHGVIEYGFAEHFRLDILAAGEHKTVAQLAKLVGAVLRCDNRHSSRSGYGVSIGAAQDYLPRGIGA